MEEKRWRVYMLNAWKMYCTNFSLRFSRRRLGKKAEPLAAIETFQGIS